MRRYSEVPNTPTPYSKSTHNELKLGSIITIPGVGKAVLRFVGPIEGKNGEFAGIELLGESASLGKNSGDVNGVSYFKTKHSGAGLFMTLEKLKNSIEYIDSPPKKRLSMMTSPGIRFNATPSRNGNGNANGTTNGSANTTTTTKKSYHTPGLASSVKKSQGQIGSRAQSTPPAPSIATSSHSTKSPLEKEIQRLNSVKLVIENERDGLLKQTESLKNELSIITVNFTENEKLVKTLESSLKEVQEKYDSISEKSTLAENKLVKQRKAYESQRKELLEVIDQVEAQVNDNEQLYIGELKKLQEELNQKQEIIEDLKKKQNDLQGLYEKQKNALTSNDKHDEELLNEINNLKLTNLTQSKAIEHLRQDLMQKENRIVELNTQSLALKETHISENETLATQIEEYKSRIDNLSAIVDQKESNIIELKNDLQRSKENQSDNDQSEKIISDLKDEIHSLNLKVLEKIDLEKQVEELNLIIKNLRDENEQNMNDKSIEKVQEFEIEMTKKDEIINNLKEQLNNREMKNNNDIDEKDNIINNLKNELNLKTKEFENFKSKELENENVLGEKISTIKQLELKISSLETENFRAIEANTKSGEKDREIHSITNKFNELKLQRDLDNKSLKDHILLTEEKDKEIQSIKEKYESLKSELSLFAELKTELELIKEEKNNLLETISNKNQEIIKLTPTSKLKEMSTQTDEDTQFEDIIEEKALEIELLKEEVLSLKSTDTRKEIQSLKNQIELLDKLSRSTTNKELNHQIKLLKDELDSRPTIIEVQELRSELELIDELRRVESKTKDKEIQQLKDRLYPLSSLSRTPTSISSSPMYGVSANKTPEMKRQSQSVGIRTSMRPLSLNRPPIISQVVDGALQVYVPDIAKDPGNGRHLWCGLCEREGHDSIDCPYDNEIF